MLIRPSMMVLALMGAGLVPLSALAEPSTPVANVPPPAERERINIDKDWRFAFGNATDPSKDFNYSLRPFFFAKAGYGDGPADPKFNDVGWRKVDLPHDWAVELPFDPKGDTNHGSKALGEGFPQNSIGWYRKVIDIPASDNGRRVSIDFDGVFRDSVVWVNGHYMGEAHSGYSSFGYDISDYLNYGGRNVIAVRVDATIQEGWFYEGAGIYRHVWLTKTNDLHVAKWGTFVRSTVAAQTAGLDIDTSVDNDARTDGTFSLVEDVVDPSGHTVAHDETPNLTVKSESSATFHSNLNVSDPHLWSLEAPNLYHLKTRIVKDGQVVDSYDTTFGIRTIVWDPNKGFFLNGKPVRIHGVANHQDAAGVGVALPDGLEAWRLQRLKDMGVNAYRTAHHPPTPELLDAADRLGVLVLDENRLMGTTPEIRGQLEGMVERDRNHPSVVIWSIGNEEWVLEGTPLGTHLADVMQDTVHRMDPSRRTTVATSYSGKGVSVAADVIGFNYAAQHDVDAFHREFPDKPAVMTEEGATAATRGIYFDDRAHVHLAAYDREGRPGSSSSIEEGWNHVIARPWMSGMFVWAGFDYRGEPGFGWPAISSQSGMLDSTGVFKDSAFYLKSVWTSAPMVHVLPHWTWPGREGQVIDVRVYSNADTVELRLNGKSLGRKAMIPNGHLQWDVPYHPGTLEARGYINGKLVAKDDAVTAGDPAEVTLTPDKTAMHSDGTDVSVVWVNVKDAAGHLAPTASNLVTFDASGPIRIIGMGNGDPGSHEADKVADRYEFQLLSKWRSLAVDSIENRPEVAADVDTSNWRDPMRWLPAEKQPPATPGLILRGQFVKPELKEGDKVSLFVANLSPDQKIYLNGTEIQGEAVAGGSRIQLDVPSLQPVNSVTYVFSTPKGGVPVLVDASVGESVWGSLRIEHPAAPWQRSVFGGWAQVIVQSTDGVGQGTLRASSTGLTSAAVSFDVK